MVYVMVRGLAILGLLLVVAGLLGVYRTLPHKGPATQSTVACPDPLLTSLPEDVNLQVAYLKRLSPDALQAYQRARLNADISRLATGQVGIDEATAQVLYGPDWQQKVSAYKALRERREYMLTGSLLAMLKGGLLLICCLAIGLIRVIRKAFGWSWHALFDRKRPQVCSQPAKSNPVATEQIEDRPKVQAGPSGRRRVTIGLGLPACEPLPYLRHYADTQQV
jgi:hypothetical protein